MSMEIRPIRKHVLLLDDPDETVVDGVVVKTGMWRTNMDYLVIGVGTEEKAGFGQGDRVVLGDPNAGRRLKLDGIPMRLVRMAEVIGVLTDGEGD